MDTCTDVATCAAIYLPAAFETAFGIVATASAIAALTPTPNDDRWVGKVYRVLDALALNVGFAKDKSKSKGGRFVPV